MLPQVRMWRSNLHSTHVWNKCSRTRWVNPINSHVGEPANKGRGDPSTSKLNNNNRTFKTSLAKPICQLFTNEKLLKFNKFLHQLKFANRSKNYTAVYIQRVSPDWSADSETTWTGAKASKVRKSNMDYWGIGGSTQLTAHSWWINTRS